MWDAVTGKKERGTEKVKLVWHAKFSKQTDYLLTKLE